MYYKYNMQERYWLKRKPHLLIIKSKNQLQISNLLYQTFHVSQITFTNKEDVNHYILSNVVDAIYTNITDVSYVKELLQLNIPIYLTYPLSDTIYVNDVVLPNTYTFGGYVYSESNRKCKRFLDIVGGLIGSFIAIIFILIFSPLICMETPGHAIFKQERIGTNGRHFSFPKLRSMYCQAEEEKHLLKHKNEMDGFIFKMNNDPRITKIGKFIRKTSIDEFPQFFLVLKGEMSLVGTRPPVLNEYNHYDIYHKGRLACKPGLTGLWQVGGKNKEKIFDKIVELDNEYMRHSSFFYDVKLLWKTFTVMFQNQ